MSKTFLTPVVLPADPVAAMEAATKQYVDAQIPGGTGLGYVMGIPIYLTILGSGQNFVKASRAPGATAWLIEALGGGGASGGAGATGAGAVAVGGGGGGGGYARAFVLDADVAATAVFSVGQGGTAPGGAAADGNDGSRSEFNLTGSLPRVYGAGGVGGGGSTAFTPLSGVPGGAAQGGTANEGDFTVDGGDALIGFALAATRIVVSAGGGSFYGGTRGRSLVGASASGGGQGRKWGGGAYGAANAQNQSATVGASGYQGLVIVTPFYGGP